MKKVVALMLGLALLAVVLTPQAEAAHGRGAAFFVGALTGALVAGAVASSYAYPAYYYSYAQPVAVQQPVYQPYPVYRPVYVGPRYSPDPYYGSEWGWYYR